MIEVSLTKPMGIVFSERHSTGLYISSLPLTGKAARSGLLAVNDVLTHVGSTRMDTLTFAKAMEIMAGVTGDHVRMTFKRPRKANRRREKESEGEHSTWLDQMCMRNGLCGAERDTLSVSRGDTTDDDSTVSPVPSSRAGTATAFVLSSDFDDAASVRTGGHALTPMARFRIAAAKNAIQYAAEEQRSSVPPPTPQQPPLQPKVEVKPPPAAVYGPAPRPADYMPPPPSLRSSIQVLLSKHEPARLAQFDKLMRKFEGRESECLARLTARYDSYTQQEAPSAPPPVAPPPAAPPPAVAPPTSAPLAPPPPVDSQTSLFASLEPRREIQPIGEPPRVDKVECTTPVSAGTQNEQDEEDEEDEEDEVPPAPLPPAPPAFPNPFVNSISSLVIFVYGDASSGDHKARLKTIFSAYKGREQVLLKLLETKAELKRAADPAVGGGVPTTIVYMSEARSEDLDSVDDGPRRPRKGITTSSTGDASTVSTISSGTASFQKVSDMNARYAAAPTPAAPYASAAAPAEDEKKSKKWWQRKNKSESKSQAPAKSRQDAARRSAAKSQV